jgi:Flp pilus assembly protein TadD
VFLAKSEVDRAIADAASAIQLDPNLAGAYATRGAAAMRKGELDRARADLDRME